MARCVVAADSDSLVERLPSRPRGSRLLIVEHDSVVHIIADPLHSRPTRRHIPEQIPGRLGQQIRLAITAAQQEDESIFRQILNRVLLGIGDHHVRLAGIADERIGCDSDGPPGPNPGETTGVNPPPPLSP